MRVAEATLTGRSVIVTAAIIHIAFGTAWKRSCTGFRFFSGKLEA